MAGALNDLIYIHNDSLVELTTPNTKREFFKQIGLIFGLLVLIIDTIFGLSADSWRVFLIPGDISVAIMYWGLHLLAICSLCLWRITPETRLLFDRASKDVILMHGKERFRFPWNVVQFQSQWMPTKLGGIQFLTIKAGPPFPEYLQKKFSNQLAKHGSEGGLIPSECARGFETGEFHNLV